VRVNMHDSRVSFLFIVSVSPLLNIGLPDLVIKWICLPFKHQHEALAGLGFCNLAMYRARALMLTVNLKGGRFFFSLRRICVADSIQERETQLAIQHSLQLGM
jgi:hypothetical protein